MVRLFQMALYAVAFTTSVLWGSEGVISGKVTLWLDLPSNCTPLTARQLERELQTIVEPTGLELQWQRLPVQPGAVVAGSSIVVRFRGSCVPALDAGRHHAAGWAHVSDGNILPFIEIDCDQVWSVIEAGLENESGFQREFYLGRALARVLAHELHHVLSRTMEHGTQGLTKARLASRDLVAGSYTLSPADLAPAVRASDASAVASLPASSGASRPAGRSASGYAASPSSFAPEPSGR